MFNVNSLAGRCFLAVSLIGYHCFDGLHWRHVRKMALVAVCMIAVAIFARLQVRQMADHRLFAFDPETKQRISEEPLLFLYAVNTNTGTVETYSPVLSYLKALSGAITQTPTTVEPIATKTGFLANVTVVSIDETVDRSKEDFLPSLTWVDLQGRLQRQFFVKGVDRIYVSDQPLKESIDGRLESPIAVR